MDKKRKNFIISILRRGSYKWSARNEALQKAKEQSGSFSTGRPKYKYRCSKCNELFMKKDICLDHIDPVIPLEWICDDDFDWNIYLDRMYCQAIGFQVLCSSCHDIKTKEENEIRTTNKREFREAKKAKN